MLWYSWQNWQSNKAVSFLFSLETIYPVVFHYIYLTVLMHAYLWCLLHWESKLRNVIYREIKTDFQTKITVPLGLENYSHLIQYSWYTRLLFWLGSPEDFQSYFGSWFISDMKNHLPLSPGSDVSHTIHCLARAVSESQCWASRVLWWLHSSALSEG